MMPRIRWFALPLALAIWSLIAAVSGAEPPAQAGDATRGKYLATLGGCMGCHGAQLSGGNRFDLGPAGEVFASNITPHNPTGIGGWTDAQIIAALRTGKRPDGTQLAPVMPYMALSGMSDQDARDMVAYLKSVPAVQNQVGARRVTNPFPAFNPPAAPATSPASGVDRGRYLEDVLVRCGQCHTPTLANGAPDPSKMLAGRAGARTNVPNITPDNDTGIGRWSQADIVTLLKTGARPGGRPAVAGGMAQQIQARYKELTDADATAIATFLKSIPAVQNALPAPAAPAAQATGAVGTPRAGTPSAAGTPQPAATPGGLPTTGEPQPLGDLNPLWLALGALAVSLGLLLRPRRRA